MSWLYLLYFDLSRFTQSVCIKVIYSWNFRCSWKEAVLLLLSWSTLHVAVSKCIVSWFYFLYFNLRLLTESAYVKFNFSWNFRGSTKEGVTLLRSWSTLYMTFSRCKVSRFWLFYLDLSLFLKSVCIKGIFFIVDYFWGFYFSISYWNSISYIPLLWKFLLFCQERNNVTSRIAHPVHCTFRV